MRLLAVACLVFLGCTPQGFDDPVGRELAVDELPPPNINVSPSVSSVSPGGTVTFTVTLPVSRSGVRVYVPVSDGGLGNGVCPNVLMGQCLGIVGDLSFQSNTTSNIGVTQVTATVPVSHSSNVMGYQAIVLTPSRAFLSAPAVLPVVQAVDADNDGVGANTDCDDDDASLGDIAYDADCDGTLTGQDCDDDDPWAYPGAAEEEGSACMRDADEDGWGDDQVSSPVVAGTDCDDDDARTFPNAAPYNNLFRPDLCERDRDGDGYGDATQGQRYSAGSDCYDYDSRANPGQDEGFTSPRPDGSWDFDCSGSVEEDFPDTHSLIFGRSGWDGGPVPDCGYGRDRYVYGGGGSSYVVLTPMVTWHEYPDVPKTEQVGGSWYFVQSCK